MIGSESFYPSRVSLPSQSGVLSQVPVSWPLANTYSVSNDASLTAATLAALQAFSGSQTMACPVPPANPHLASQVLDDFAECVSELSDLESSAVAPSLSSVYELSCALSPASSVDSALSADYESTSPLSHYYPLTSDGLSISGSCSPNVPTSAADSTCAAVEQASADMKPLLRKPIDISKLDSKQVKRLMRRRERNKVAASKCRQKIKEKAACVRDQLRDTTAANERLRQEVETLRAEKAKLERILASHHCVLPGCGDSETEDLTPPTSPKSETSEE